MGTAAYMSPEQARGETVDAHRRLRAGHRVVPDGHGTAGVHRATLATVFDAVLNHTPPPASTIAPRVPAALSNVIAKALEKDRDRRYQRIADLRADLQQVVDSATTSASMGAPTSSHTDGTRQASRLPLFLGLGAVVAIVFAAGFWIWSGQSQRAQPTSSAAATVRSLAVLPLENLSGGAESEYFTDGMTDELITALAGVRDGA